MNQVKCVIEQKNAIAVVKISEAKKKGISLNKLFMSFWFVSSIDL